MSDLKPKILATTSLLLLMFALYIVTTTPLATGYELSIYNAYPPYFFIVILISFSCSLLGILHSIYAEKIGISCLANIFAILAFNIILILLPLFRGYAFYERHDALTHVGIIKDILRSAHLSSDNFYPIFHVFPSVILQITDINNMFFLIREFIPLAFYIFYIFCIYLIVKEITKDSKASLFAFLFASVPLFGGQLTAFTPSDILFFIVPFLLYSFYLDLHAHSIKTKILFIIGLILVPYMHPEIVIFLIISFLLFFILTKFFDLKNVTNKNVFLNPLLILFISFFIWFSTSSQFSLYSRRLYLWFSKEIGSAPINYYRTLLSRAQLSLNEFLELLIKREGARMIYFILASLTILVIIKNIFSKRKVERNQVFFGLLFLSVSFFAAFSLFNDVVVGYGRVLKYAILSSTILISIFLISYRDKTKVNTSKNKLFFLIVFCVLVTSTAISTFNLHPSPIVRSYNSQVTAMEINGANWLVEFGDRNIEPMDMFITFGRFVQAKQGYDYSMQEDRTYATALYSTKRSPPDHFNYMYYNTLGESYSEDKYLLTNKLMKLFYFELWPDIARFTTDDFRKIDIDATVNRIYENGEFVIRYIIKKAES